ncbi:MAG: hypothetical protein BGO29_09940 [Bacteroidales bacterium 36-12]|nr:MAG: hypothetical protein BGO29_09940 [Bacteroidales bacterium 36-12]
MKKNFLYLLFFIFTFGEVSAQKWTNPFTLGNEWGQYGIGDPYILKYNGSYYLYCSTRDRTEGVKCFVSKDLVNWSAAYMCSTDPITRGAYAPEVVYWNGTFYMYTSPAGNGHYVLTSTSPTGPFTRVTENFGKSIDGSVFIEDDGTWYFYHAGGGGGGMQGCTMSSPTTVGAGRNIGVSMNNDWTEGPTLIKRNGVYYMIYTGNHVISKGYRIDYAKNTSGPLATFTPQAKQNPILVNTEGTNVGLGHGSAFIGPDLDSYYYTYHSLAGDYGWGPYRRFNYDRIAWNGDKMTILGPTVWAQEAPEMPTGYDFFERAEIGSDWTMPNGGNWGIYNSELMYQDKFDDTEETWRKALYITETESNYTAEFTAKEVSRHNDNAKYGAVFGYTDEQNYGIALFRSKTNQIEINFQINGVWGTPKMVNLPAGYDYTKWHSIRIEKSGTNYKFFVDGMLKNTSTSALGAGKIGYMNSWSHSDFGYIAFSNKVNGSGIFDIYKPIPGTIEAVHYNTGGEGVGYHELTPGNAGGKYIREDDVDISNCSEGGYAITSIQAGEWYAYNVNTRYPLTYNAGIRYASTQNASFRILQDDNVIADNIELSSTNGAWKTVIVKDLNLTNGYHTLKVEAISGEFSLYDMQFDLALNTPTTKEDNFDGGTAGWYYIDGAWEIRSGQAYIKGYGKRTMTTGTAPWTDYTVQVDVTYINGMNGGLLLRAKNLALGSNGTSPQAGTDFLQGYYISLSSNAVVLGKQNYNWAQLKSAPGNYVTNKKYTLKASIIGADIKVYVDDVLVMEYTDPNPFVTGRPGLRVHNTEVYFDNFKVTVHDGDVSSVKELNISKNNIFIYPNPVDTMLSIHNISDASDISIYDVNGQKVFHSQLNGESYLTLNMSDYQDGLYLVELTGNDKSVVRKFIKNQ